MPFEAEADDVDRFNFLNILCAPLGKAWRVYAHPSFMPQHLAQCFDRRLEAQAMALDWEDLDRYMSRKGAAYEKRVSTNGCVELTARDDAAAVLGAWIATALGSGVRLY